MNDESENNICRRRKGTKRLLIMTSLVFLGIGILFVVTLINVEPGSSGEYYLISGLLGPTFLDKNDIIDNVSQNL